MYKVLLIDDEEWILKGIELIFPWEKYGFEVMDKTTLSTKGWDIICNNTPDVVFTDIRMPVIDGLSLAAKAREKGINSEFIIISGFSDFSYAQEAIRNSVFDYFLKPIDEEDAEALLAKLKSHLDKKYGITDDVMADIYNKEFKNIVSYINEHYGEKLQLNELAKKFYINANYCSILFKKYFNTSFSDYLTKIRMEKALLLLKNKTSSLTEVATHVGFSDYNYFNKVFRKYHGVAPSNFRKGEANEK